MKHLLLTLSLCTLTSTGAAQEAAPSQRMVTVELGPGGLELLLRNDFDVIHVDHGIAGAARRSYDVVATDEELDRLERLEIPYEIVHQDLARFYEDRLAVPAEAAPELGGFLSPAFGSGSMGGYYTWAEVGSVLDQIAAAYPAIVTPKFSIGASLEGRQIWAVKLSDNPAVDENEPEVRFDSMHHAREPEGMQSSLWTLLWLVENYGSDPRATWIVDNREIWFLPVVNPDGYVYNQTTNPGGGGLWRKNRRDNGDGTFGVDLNRNYDFQWGFDNSGSSPTTSSETYRGPSAASEPEVQAMAAFMASRSFGTALSVHTFSNLWLSPWGYTSNLPANNAVYDEISAHATEVNGYTYGSASTVLYPANGVTVDYDQGVHGTLSWTPEIGGDADGFWPLQSRIVPLAEENLEGFLRTALAAGSYARVVDVSLNDGGDGDGFFEVGETVELVVSVRNTGLLATLDDVTLGLSSSSTDATVTQAAANLGSINAFTGADNAGAPLTLAIDSGVAGGTQVAYDLTLSFDGLTRTFPATFIVGEPTDFVRDDLEIALGWEAGQPGDTASTGLWEYGDPVGTSSGGQPSNPENDASAAGVNCFTTGNGSTSAGGDDVDDGFTTLVTPPIDLSGVAAARLSYARWYVDLTNNDDTFDVSISDGGPWVSLESVAQTANSWTRVSFFVSDYVSLTDSVRVRFVASDDPNNSLVEAAVDDLLVEVFDTDPRFNVFGRPQIGTDIAFHTTGPDGSAYGIFESSGTGLVNFGLINGPLLLDPFTLILLVNGNIAAGGLQRDVLTIPNAPILQGVTLYYQALVSGPGGLFLTNRDEITFE